MAKPVQDRRFDVDSDDQRSAYDSYRAEEQTTLIHGWILAD